MAEEDRRFNNLRNRIIRAAVADASGVEGADLAVRATASALTTMLIGITADRESAMAALDEIVAAMRNDVEETAKPSGTKAIAISAVHARHGMTASEYQADFDTFSQQGYRIISLSIYGGSDPRYAAVWVKRSGPAWQAFHGRDAAGYQAFFNEWTGKGYLPRIITVTGSGTSAVFAAVFEKMTVAGSWFARHGIDKAAFDQANNDAHTNGQILISAAVYGTPSNRAYAGIWMPNSGNVQWLVHLDANGTGYQVWFDGATQIPMRPALVIPTEDHAYLSVFRDDSVGAWDARHGLSSAAYQKAFDDFVAHGKLPLDVHGGGSGSNARYAAVFAGQVDPEPRA